MSPSTRNTVAWMLQILVALAFIGSGANKFAHLADTVKGFAGMGFPGWFAYLIAGGEVLGGIGLLVPRFTRLAAVCLMPIMVGAAYLHATKIPGGFVPMGFPSVVLLALLVVIVLLRRPAAVAA